MLRSKCNLDLFPHAGRGSGWCGGVCGERWWVLHMDICGFPMNFVGYLAHGFALFVKFCRCGVQNLTLA